MEDGLRIIFRNQSYYLVESYKTQTALIELLADPNVKYASMFNNFFKSGVMVSSYKPVFLRALTDLGRYGSDGLVGKQWITKKNGKINLELDFIAVRFAKYYWDTEVAFQMRHIPERMAGTERPTDDINILKIIRDEETQIRKQSLKNAIDSMDSNILDDDKFDKMMDIEKKSRRPPTLQELSSEDMVEFRESVIKSSIKPEVLNKLLNDMPGLYERVMGENHIVLDEEFITFMRDFAPVIKKALNYVLASHLEKYNPSVRHIATKVDDEKDFEKTLEIIKRLENKIVEEIISEKSNKLLEKPNILT